MLVELSLNKIPGEEVLSYEPNSLSFPERCKYILSDQDNLGDNSLNETDQKKMDLVERPRKVS